MKIQSEKVNLFNTLLEITYFYFFTFLVIHCYHLCHMCTKPIINVMLKINKKKRFYLKNFKTFKLIVHF